MQVNKLFSDWLARAGVSENTQKTFNISSRVTPNGDECIVIPVLDVDGNFLFNKYRRSPFVEHGPKYFYDRGSRVSLYGAHLLHGADKVVITEGEKDALVCWSHNIPAVTSTGGANSFQKDWVPLFKGKEVIICFDNDEAGASGMVKVLEHLPEAKILLLPDKPGVKDISDYVAHGGDLHAILSESRHYPDTASVKEEKARKVALWQNTFFHDKYLKKFDAPRIVHKGKVTYSGDKVTRAKQYPIPNLIRFSQNKSKCLWHDEKTPSLNYYEKTNTVYCFGCGKSADAIDVYRALHNCDFKTALSALDQNNHEA